MLPTLRSPPKPIQRLSQSAIRFIAYAVLRRESRVSLAGSVGGLVVTPAFPGRQRHSLYRNIVGLEFPHENLVQCSFESSHKGPLDSFLKVNVFWMVSHLLA